jgi:hypothetical protein
LSAANENTAALAIVRHVANFDGFVFPGPAKFGHAEFAEKASFKKTLFFNSADFDDAVFFGNADFWGAIFSGRLDIRRVKFNGKARFFGATFDGLATFWHTDFRGEVDFEAASFRNITGVGETKFAAEANFSGIRSERAFRIRGAQFKCVPDFSEADFKQAVDFEDVLFPSPSFWKVGDPGLVKRYRALRRMAIQSADYDREQIAFTGEMRSKRGTEHKVYNPAFWFGIIYDVLGSFGYSIGRPLFFWITSNLLFALIYLSNTSTDVADWLAKCPGTNSYVWEKALTLSFGNALVFGSFRPLDVGAIYGCLYTISTGSQLSAGSQPILPPWSTALQIGQGAWSAILLFLLLLGLRNQFRIK